MTAQTTATDRAAISRANGRKSQVPTSPEGRARSSMNALEHGLTSKLAVLPSESESDYRAPCDAFFDDIGPRDLLEAALTEQAASSLGMIARAQRAEAAAVAAAVRAAAADRHQGEVGAMGHWMLTCDVFNRIGSARSLIAFLPKEHHEPFRKGRGEPS